MKESAHIILFDGHCNLCNGFVNFILIRDGNAIFKFGSLQSDKVQELLKERGFSKSDYHSVIYLENGQIYFESTAALKISKKLNGLWPVLYGFIVLPKFIRDAVYRFVAKNRYKWFGRREICRFPEPGLEERFLG